MIDGLTVAGLSDTGAQLKRALSMEDFDLTKSFDELLKQTDPAKEAALEDTTEVPDITSLESILLRLPPEGQAWLNGLNAYCRRAVEHDLRTAGPELFVKHPAKTRTRLGSIRQLAVALGMFIRGLPAPTSQSAPWPDFGWRRKAA